MRRSEDGRGLEGGGEEREALSEHRASSIESQHPPDTPVSDIIPINQSFTHDRPSRSAPLVAIVAC